MRKLFMGLLRGGVFLILCVLAVFLCLRRLSGESGLIEIGDDEVAVLYNRLDGSTRQVDTPGNELYLPFIERIHLLRRSPEQFVFEGETRQGPRHAAEVRLRVADGSVVRFESLALQYTLRADGAQRALEDAGGRARWPAALIEAQVRAIVRDEYGGYDAAGIRLRENQNAASAQTLARLNRALAPHGILVLELSTPKLRFDPAYETAVATRKSAIQEIERLRAEFRQLDAERNQRLAALDKQKLIELNKTRLQVRDYMAILDKDERTRRAKAQADQQSRLGEAQSRRYTLEQEALAASERYELHSQVLREEVELLAHSGAPLLREAWIERLAQTPVSIQPFSHDPEPAGVELIRTALASQ
jgi:hypothetical protein